MSDDYTITNCRGYYILVILQTKNKTIDLWKKKEICMQNWAIPKFWNVNNVANASIWKLKQSRNL